jgi:hypothetical protein
MNRTKEIFLRIEYLHRVLNIIYYIKMSRKLTLNRCKKILKEAGYEISEIVMVVLS